MEQLDRELLRLNKNIAKLGELSTRAGKQAEVFNELSTNYHSCCESDYFNGFSERVFSGARLRPDRGRHI